MSTDVLSPPPPPPLPPPSFRWIFSPDELSPWFCGLASPPHHISCGSFPSPLVPSGVNPFPPPHPPPPPLHHRPTQKPGSFSFFCVFLRGPPLFFFMPFSPQHKRVNRVVYLCFQPRPPRFAWTFVCNTSPRFLPPPPPIGLGCCIMFCLHPPLWNVVAHGSSPHTVFLLIGPTSPAFPFPWVPLFCPSCNGCDVLSYLRNGFCFAAPLTSLHMPLDTLFLRRLTPPLACLFPFCRSSFAFVFPFFLFRLRQHSL